ncbi:Uncharacterized protein TCM_024500 [Theobroma cacao]|uniref:Uncharacterized protein n=1 Tax=Theobroma cacao TaxID=3641 RepID=A0A061EXI3_THECC|nr:Uncharacterized protein TCM_024500 [Theobroma cacao]
MIEVISKLFKDHQSIQHQCCLKSRWVKVEEIPCHIWHEDSFRAITNAWGKFIKIDHNNDEKWRLDFAMILVEVKSLRIIKAFIDISVNGKEYYVRAFVSNILQSNPLIRLANVVEGYSLEDMVWKASKEDGIGLGLSGSILSERADGNNKVPNLVVQEELYGVKKAASFALRRRCQVRKKIHKCLNHDSDVFVTKCQREAELT